MNLDCRLKMSQGAWKKGHLQYGIMIMKNNFVAESLRHTHMENKYFLFEVSIWNKEGKSTKRPKTPSKMNTNKSNHETMNF